LGAKLLDRSRRPLLLTPEGKLYFDFCRDVLRRYDEFVAALDGPNGHTESAVRVASIYSIGLSEMTALEEEFARRMPGAEIAVEYLRPEKVYDAVLKERAELGLVSYPEQSKEIRVIPWREETMVVALSPRHRLVGAAVLGAADLHGEDFVGFFGFGFEAGDEAAEFLEFGEVVERLEEHLAEMGFQAGDFEQHFGAADHDAADEDRRHVVEVGAFREAVDLEDVGVAEDAAALFAEEAGFHAAETVETPLVGGDVVDEVAFDGAARLEVFDVFGERFKALRDKYGSGVDIGIDFHGAVQPPTAMLLVKALEPYHPWFYEEVVQCLNVDVMAEIARKTHIPLATGERIFTKWGFREILEKRASLILQPDVCYAGGITELLVIAGMADAYYSPLAPHNPQGPCSLAASLQVAASIPNFLIQERGDNEYSDLLTKPLPPVQNGHRALLTDPGLGITIDEDKLKAQVGEPREYQARFDPDDGSVVDW
jgi:L-alanine-DL-glutamate epimerase-like enolase superfamily enzyme